MKATQLSWITWIIASLMWSCDDEAEQSEKLKTDHDMVTVMNQSIITMNAYHMTLDTDYDFAKTMRYHHAGAAALATLELASSGEASLRDVSQQIITQQQSEISTLDSFITHHAPVVRRPLLITQQDRDFGNKIRSARLKLEKNVALLNVTGDTDIDFASLMILHHQTAIEMEQYYIEHGRYESLITLANRMIEEHSNQINRLQDWLLGHQR